MAAAYAKAIEPLSYVKEQLRLFAFGDSPSISQEILTQIHKTLNKRQRLATLLDGELDFHGENSSYASHDLHAFAAKFPPQLPRAFIRGLTDPGDVVLDPMMGSGTTLVEALLEGRDAIGIDIDPLALLLCRVKTTSLDTNRLHITGNKVLTKAYSLLENAPLIESAINDRFSGATREFIDYWFLPATQHQLMALALAISDVDDEDIKAFLRLTFSAIIVTKSGGVSRARDLAHSRPHLDSEKVPKDALVQFSNRLKKNLRSISQFNSNGNRVIIQAGDARDMPFADESVDLIVTSPPYANAIDYMRAHKFSLVWFGQSVSELSELRARYIGSERVGKAKYSALPSFSESIVQKLVEIDAGKAGILRKYLLEMKSAFEEMFRVLRTDSSAIVVIGSSVMRGQDVETHRCLSEIAGSVGFDVVGIAKRNLDRNKRMMPARFGGKTASMIEQRTHEEFVIGLLKPASFEGKMNANA